MVLEERAHACECADDARLCNKGLTPMLARPRSCPADDTLANFVDGRLSDDQRPQMESHVGECDACRALVAAMGKGADGPRNALRLPTVDSESYAIEREIARGGMGRILEAWDCTHQRTVALKLSLRASDEVARRFEREIAITARLSHPAIIPLYAAGRWLGGEPFFAMKRVDGRSFAEVAAEAGSLKEKLAQLPHLVAVTDALAYAHGRGIVHRDLKPSNVLVGAFGETVVIDWGLARDLNDDENECDERRAVGTPGFMPPEQARGDAVGARADVYALGALLYHLLAGRAPHHGGNARAALQAVVDGPPTPLRRLVPEAPADLVALVEKAMARDPADRYPSAREMAEDLRRFVTGQLVSAHTYTFGVLLGRWAARHKAALTIAAVSLGIVALLSVLGVRRIVRERDRADQARAAAVAQRDAAEKLVGYVIHTLRSRLETLGRLDLLRGVGSEVDTYYESASQGGEMPDVPALLQRATALQSLAGVESYELHGPGAAPLFASAEKLLERALVLDPDNLDAEVELVRVHVSEAGQLMDQGHDDEALAHVGRAIEVGHSAVAAHPDDPRALAALSRGQLRKALVMRYAGRNDPVDDLYAEACERLDRARAAAAPTEYDLRRQSGWAYVEWGDGARLRGDNAVALSALQKSVAILEPLATDDPGASRRRDLGWAVLRLSEVQVRVGDRAAALAGFERVIALRESLLADDPTNPSLKRDVAITRQVACNDENAAGWSDEAVANCERALAVIDALAETRPDNVPTQSDLGMILSSLAAAELNAHRDRQALAHLERSEVILGKLASPTPEAAAALDNLGPLLGRALLAAGDATGAARAAQRGLDRAERRTNERPAAAGAWAALAGSYMVLGDVSEARKEPARAVNAYRAAHDAFGRAQTLHVDPAADAVRTAVAADALAAVLPQTTQGRADARALYTETIAALEPLERSERLDAQGKKMLGKARTGLAR